MMYETDFIWKRKIQNHWQLRSLVAIDSSIRFHPDGPGYARVPADQVINRALIIILL